MDRLEQLERAIVRIVNKLDNIDRMLDGGLSLPDEAYWLDEDILTEALKTEADETYQQFKACAAELAKPENGAWQFNDPEDVLRVFKCS